MFSLVRTHLINSVKSFKRLFQVSKTTKTETVNPWEADLARLAAERRDGEMVVAAAPGDDITAFVNDLAKAISKEAPVETKKARRRTDPTVTDLKAWWGESVATWDPETDANNVQSADQRNRLRQATWLQKGPQQFDK